MLKSNIAILQSYSVAVSRNYEIILYFLFYCMAVFCLMTSGVYIFTLYTLHEVVFTLLKRFKQS